MIALRFSLRVLTEMAGNETASHRTDPSRGSGPSRGHAHPRDHRTPSLAVRPVGLVDDDPRLLGMPSRAPDTGDHPRKRRSWPRKHDVTQIVVAIPSPPPIRSPASIAYAAVGAQIKVLPSLADLVSGNGEPRVAAISTSKTYSAAQRIQTNVGQSSSTSRADSDGHGRRRLDRVGTLRQIARFNPKRSYSWITTSPHFTNCTRLSRRLDTPAMSSVPRTSATAQDR